MNIIGVDHVSIQTNDFASALNFYQNILGFTLIKPPYNFKSRTLCYLQAGSIAIELYSCKRENAPATAYTGNRAGLDHISFSVRNLFEVIAELRKKGVHVIKGPFKPPTNDPQQVLIAFIEGPDNQEIELREAKVDK